MKKVILAVLGVLIGLFFGISSNAFVTDGGIEFDVAEPYGATGYTTVVPDTPQSGYNVFLKQNADVGVAINYDESVNLTFYKYDYLINIISDQPSYYCFNLGSNKVSKYDKYEYYLIDSFCLAYRFCGNDLARRYSSIDCAELQFGKNNGLINTCLCDVNHIYHIENDGGLKENSFSFYYSGNGTIQSGEYYLVQTVEGDKSSTMNEVDVNLTLTMDTPIFNETLNRKFFVGSNSVDDYYLDGENKENCIYKQKNNVCFMLYKYVDAGGKDILGCYCYGIFPIDFGEFDVFYDNGSSITNYSYLTSEEQDTMICFFDKNTTFNISTYNTLSLTYSYKVYTPVDVQEITFNDYKTSVSKLVSETLDNVYQNAYNAGVISKQAEIDRLNNQISTLSKDVDSLKNEKSDLELDIAALNARIEELKANGVTDDATIVELENQLVNLKSENEILESEISEKENKIDILQKNISIMQFELNNLESDEKTNQSTMTIAFSIIGGFALISLIVFLVVFIRHKVCD